MIIGIGQVEDAYWLSQLSGFYSYFIRERTMVL